MKLGFGTMPDARVTTGAIDETIVSINDDDHPEVKVQFGQDSQGVGEGETVNVTVSLGRRPGAHRRNPHHGHREPDGATSDDYTVPNSVTFNAGETEKTIAFMATQDEENDDEESVELGFGSPRCPSG